MSILTIKTLNYFFVTFLKTIAPKMNYCMQATAVVHWRANVYQWLVEVLQHKNHICLKSISNLVIPSWLRPPTWPVPVVGPSCSRMLMAIWFQPGTTGVKQSRGPRRRCTHLGSGRDKYLPAGVLQERKRCVIIISLRSCCVRACVRTCVLFFLSK